MRHRLYATLSTYAGLLETRKQTLSSPLNDLGHVYHTGIKLKFETESKKSSRCLSRLFGEDAAAQTQQR